MASFSTKDVILNFLRGTSNQMHSSHATVNICADGLYVYSTRIAVKVLPMTCPIIMRYILEPHMYGDSVTVRKYKTILLRMALDERVPYAFGNLWHLRGPSIDEEIAHTPIEPKGSITLAQAYGREPLE